jgi:hypothetical protein
MNERIKELAEEADLLGNFTPTKVPGHYAGIIKITDIEKFAELIVIECARQCRYNVEFNRILDQFGVENE